MPLVQSYNDDLAATAKHLQWPEAKVSAAVNYTEAFVEEIAQTLNEYRALDFTALQRLLPQAVEFSAGAAKR
jgi:protoheme ferro-lyase